jgi:SAM-dependent methyltransferase
MTLDELARYNRERWEALAAARVEYSRPLLDLTAATARHVVDPFGVMGEVRGQRVLCLAGGGGQQSVAFGLLGAQVTVLDLAPTQLERDREALAHYGLRATLLEGDMRDLSRFEAASFDVVWHAHSIVFVPDVRPVFDGVRRVLRPGGLYHLAWNNPFTMAASDLWNGDGYLLRRRYGDGPVELEDPHWTITDADGATQRVLGPREFCHTLSTVINNLAQRGLTLIGLWEETSSAASPEPGTWEHYKAVLAPYLTLWAKAAG